MTGTVTEAAVRPAETAAEERAGGFIGPPGLIRLRTRYTRFVGTMKLVLPLVAGVLIAMVLVWPQMKDQPKGLGLVTSATGVADGGSGQTVLHARYRGVDSQGQPYVVTAEEAHEGEGGPDDSVELTNPKADITLGDGAWIAAASPEGTYLRDTGKLLLDGGISLFHIGGYEIRTPSATVDLENGTAQGTERIKGQGPAGTLVASGFRVLERGARIVFTGDAKLVLYGKPGGPAK